MTSAPSPVDRLRSYLSDLTPEARALLVVELEREVLRGGDPMDVVLRELTAALRGRGGHYPRIANPLRVFYQPLEPFLVNEANPQKVRGRVPRSMLMGVWTWIGRDLIPDQTRSYSAEVTAALIASDDDAVARIARTFHEQFVAAARQAFADAAASEEAARKLTARLGSPRMLEEVRDIVGILRARDALDTVGARLPVAIRNLTEEQVDNLRAVLDSPVARPAHVFDYALVMAAGRLGQPWQILRLAVKAADSDVAAKIADSGYAVAVDLVFADTERLVQRLGAVLKSGDLARIDQTLRELHDTVRGVRTEIDLSTHGSWPRRLAAIRKEASALVTAEIGTVGGLVRRFVRVRRPGDHAPIDPAEAAAADQALDLFLTCRPYAGEIALNELAARLTSDLESTLDSACNALVEGLRTIDAADRPARMAHIDAVLRLASRLFGPAYAQVLLKAAEVAGADKRPKVAATPAARH